MSLIRLSVQHGQTREEARARLATAIEDVRTRFGSMVQRVEWSADGNAVKVFGTGFEADLWLDDREVHLTADVPIFGQLLVNGLKGILQQTFPKQLPKDNGGPPVTRTT